MKKIFTALFLFSLTCGLSFAASTDPIFPNIKKPFKLICNTTKQYACTAENCQPIRPTVHMQVNVSEQNRTQYQRCDKKGCDTYEAQILKANNFVAISPLMISSAMKINTQDMSFMETASSGLAAFIGFGHCQIMK
jgi:hypothetical protein